MFKLKRDLRNEFSLIEKLEKIENTECTLKIGEFQEGFLSFLDGKFVLETSDKEFDKITDSNRRFINVNEQVIEFSDPLTIKIDSSRLQSHKPMFKNHKSTKFEISEWSSNDFGSLVTKKPLFFRVLIPNKQKGKIRFDHYFASHWNAPKEDANLISVDDHSSMIIWNGIKLECDNTQFVVYELSNYFIIENLYPVDYQKFDKISRIILASFGLITGYVPMDFGYIFSYEDNQEKFIAFKFNSTYLATYSTQFSIVNLNPYDYYQHCDLEIKLSSEKNEIKNDPRIEEIEKEIRPVTYKMHSKLCDSMFNNTQFSNIVYEILEANRTNKSLHSRGVLYSVILEMLTTFISEEHEEKMFFIKEKTLRDKLRKALLATANEFYNENNLENFDGSPTKAKINNINAPTNRDKLIKPFEILEITLTKDEIDVINKRNDFLHGNDFLQDRNLMDSFYELFYICLELNYLVNALLLKYTGYSGKVLNLSKIYLDYTNLKQLEKADYFKVL